MAKVLHWGSPFNVDSPKQTTFLSNFYQIAAQSEIYRPLTVMTSVLGNLLAIEADAWMMLYSVVRRLRFLGRLRLLDLRCTSLDSLAFRLALHLTFYAAIGRRGGVFRLINIHRFALLLIRFWFGYSKLNGSDLELHFLRDKPYVPVTNAVTLGEPDVPPTRLCYQTHMFQRP